MRSQARPSTGSAPQRLGCIKTWPSDASRAWTVRFLGRSRDAPIDAVIAVGSAVRDVPLAGDLDLVVVYSGPKPRLETPPPVDVDIRCYERQSVEAFLAEGHDLLGSAVRLGCALLDRDGFWSRVRERWQNRIALPSVDKSVERAKVTAQHHRELLVIGDEDAAAEMELVTLTHQARARLAGAGVYPASRPELPDQLRSIGEQRLAERLAEALAGRAVAA